MHFKIIGLGSQSPSFFRKIVSTIKRWFAEIVGYFERRTTKGIVEGINNKLKLLKRAGFIATDISVKVSYFELKGAGNGEMT